MSNTMYVSNDVARRDIAEGLEQTMINGDDCHIFELFIEQANIAMRPIGINI